MSALLALVQADWRERTRRQSFWLVLGLTALAAWHSLPGQSNPGIGVLVDGHYRGAYSSAWIGISLALTLSTLLSLIGFYLVRGSLRRDIDSRVCELLLVTNMTRTGYLLSKWLSNALLLLSLLGIAALTGAAAQFWRAEDLHLRPIELLIPLLLITGPALAITAALAVLFDSVRFLRASLGNVVYFFVWVAMSMLMVAFHGAHVMSDPFGVSLAMHDVLSAAKTNFPHIKGEDFAIGASSLAKPVETFQWLIWRPEFLQVLGRLFWVLVALGLVLLGVIGLDRRLCADSRSVAAGEAASGRFNQALDALFSPLERSSSAGTLLCAELKLLLRGHSRWWWVAVLGALIMQTQPKLAIAQGGLLLAWVLLLPSCANAGLREREFGSTGLLANARFGQTLCWYRLGALCTLVILFVSPSLLRFEALSALALLAISLTLPIAGLCCAWLLGSGRPFEVLWLLLSYAALNGAPVLNPLAQPEAALKLHLPVLIGMLVLPWLWRRSLRIV